MEELSGVVVIFVMAIIYLLPGVVAISRSHPNSAAIFVLNLLLGWTLLIWVIALVWSLTNPNASQQVHVIHKD